MFCGRRPGLLLSTMKALDSMGLDIQQAVISCFNGFAMDIFRAEVYIYNFFMSSILFIYFATHDTPNSVNQFTNVFS